MMRWFRAIPELEKWASHALKLVQYLHLVSLKLPTILDLSISHAKIGDGNQNITKTCELGFNGGNRVTELYWNFPPKPIFSRDK
jgi:hypothetical protein